MNSKRSKKKETIEDLAETLQDLGEAMSLGFTSIEKRMATKEDLQGFATKDDLKNFATKDDLKGFATKDDFKIVLQRIDDVETKMATKAELHRMEERLSEEIATHIEIENTVIAELRANAKRVERQVFGKTL